VVVALVLLFTRQISPVAKRCPAGIVANAVLKLIEVEELQHLFRVRRSEFWVAIACLVSVLVLGPLKGILIAFLLALIHHLLGNGLPPSTAVWLRPRAGSLCSRSRDPEASPTQAAISSF
jgi:MFS superfamily sulfate permease-like transporter